jgi:acyl carrier protein
MNREAMTFERANTDQRNIQSRLSTLFFEVMHVEVPSVETDLFDTGILDSQKFVELLLLIEQSFHTQINIEDFEIENFRCIGKIADLIWRQQALSKGAQSSRTAAL